MDEICDKHQSDKKDLVEVRQHIIESLEDIIECLEDAGEKCEGHKMWYLVPGTPGNKIKEIIQQLQDIIIQINSIFPEKKDRTIKEMAKLIF